MHFPRCVPGSMAVGQVHRPITPGYVAFRHSGTPQGNTLLVVRDLKGPMPK